MDTPNKLVINHTFHSFLKEIDLDLIDEGSVLFDFNEYEPIVISLYSEEYDVNIECYSYYDNENYNQCENNELTLKNAESYKISDSNNTIDIGYIPSRYTISVINIKNNNKINCYFNVNSNKELSNNGMENMINHINKFIDGLSIDFFKNSKINNINSNHDNSDYYLFELISNYRTIILLKIEIITRKLKYDITPKINVELLEKKQNLKTLKKNIMKKDDRLFYNVKKVKSANNIDNILLKKYLIKILRILKNSNWDLNSILEEQNNKILKYNSAIEKIHDKLRQNNISKTDLKDYNNNLKSIENEISTSKHWHKKLSDWKKAYYDCIINISKLLESQEMTELSISNDITHSLSFYSNNDYRFFAKLYDDMIKKNTTEYEKNKKNLFSDKRSYSLFEIYGFIIIQNIIKELGFDLLLGDDNLFNFGSDSEFWYKNANYKIRVQYDHYCKKYRNNDEAAFGDIVNKNSINCKPDYIISIFKDNKLTNAIIVEMKYRKLKYMTDFKGGSTETDATIDDYSQLCGLVDNLKKPRNIISDVIILYPSLNEKIFDRNSGLFIGINAEKDFSSSLGYITLKNKIKEFIN